MASRVRIYVEGHPLLRPGFLAFFRELLGHARSKRIAVDFVFCKARALKSFSHGLTDYRHDLNLLLVDAEEAVKDNSPWNHLESRQKNKLPRPDGASDDQAHLMVQIMESWFLADKEMLVAHYERGFLEGRLPKRLDIENVPKSSVLTGLRAGTRGSKKGPYHKTIHAPELLAKLDSAKVRAASPWCERLFCTLEDVVSSS